MMSFLSLLFIGSAFYFAHARPDGITATAVAKATGNVVTSAHTAAHHSASLNPEPNNKLPLNNTQVHHDDSFDRIKDFISNIDFGSYHEQVQEFMETMNAAVDKFTAPMMVNMTKEKQDQLKTIILNGFSSCVNYMILLVNAEETYGHPLSELDEGVTVEFLDLDPLYEDAKFLPNIPEPSITKAKAESKSASKNGGHASTLAVAKID